MSPPTLVVLAGGLGSRYGGDKQFDAIGPGGAPLMDYALYDAWRAGIRRVVCVLRPEHATGLGPSLAARYRARLEVGIAVQRLDDLPAGFRPPADRTRPWGTTQAVLAAGPALSGPFVVLNADDFYGRQAIEAAAGFLAPERPPDHHAVVGYPLSITASGQGGVNRAVLEQAPDGTLLDLAEMHGLVRQPDGRFAGLTAAGPHTVPADTLVSMNLWAFGPGALTSLREAFEAFLRDRPGAADECYLPEAVRRMIRRGTGRVAVLPAGNRWCGVTYPGDRPWVAAELAELVAAGEYPERMWA